MLYLPVLPFLFCVVFAVVVLLPSSLQVLFLMFGLMLSEAQPNDIVIVPAQRKEELRLSNGQSFDGLDRSWGNSRDWVLELRDGRHVVIPPSLYRSMESLTDFTGSKDDLNIKYGQVTYSGRCLLWIGLMNLKVV
uniref:Uncharacterized protein n=1 Tax=Quercus lobata TaxID=97700 RepID=A0A7N2R8J9_QUELO